MELKIKADGVNHVPSATVYHIFSSVFGFLRDKRKQDQKRNGIHRDRTENGWVFFSSVLPVSHFWLGYFHFHPVYTFTGTSAEGVEPGCAMSRRSARLASALFGCMQNITLLVTRTCMYLKKRVRYMYVYMYMLRKNICQMSLFFYVLCVKAAYHKSVKHKKIKHGYTRVF